MRELIPWAGAPRSGLRALLFVELTALPPGHASLFQSGRILLPWLPPLSMPPRIGHIIQRTLPDQSLVERWVYYDPKSPNHSCSRISQTCFWSHCLSAPFMELAGWKLRVVDVICVPMWGLPAWEWCQSREMQSQDVERVKTSSKPWIQLGLKLVSTIPSEKSQQILVIKLIWKKSCPIHSTTDI